jgi:hypothetical protein
MWVNFNPCGSGGAAIRLARDGGRSNTSSPKVKKYFQLSGEVNPDAIRVVTETASHSHP